MLNGKVYKGQIGDLVTGYIPISLSNNKGKVKNKTIDEFRVFSYVKGSTSKICYTYDDFQGNFLTVAEAKSVTYGSYDARLKFKPRLAFWSSVGIGIGASLFDTYRTQKEVNDPGNTFTEAGFFKAQPSIFPILVPPVLFGLWAIPKRRLHEKNMIHLNYHGDANYFRGYHRIARQKRILSALLGGYIGVTVGILTYYIVNAT